MNYYIITNNPLIKSHYSKNEIIAVESYIDVLTTARDFIHKGAKLISHPQAGSIKPYETPYRSIVIDANKSDRLDFTSLSHIENAIERFSLLARTNTKIYDKKTLEDFQIVDESLLKNAIASMIN